MTVTITAEPGVNAMDGRSRLLLRLGGALLIAAAAVGGIYAAAATSATTLQATFNTRESSWHVQSVQFSREAGRVADEYEEDRTRCQRLESRNRGACLAAAGLRRPTP
jgi:hypothetical protein